VSAAAHALNCFEIPVTDFSHAKTFYEGVLGIKIEPMVMGPTTRGFLPSDPNAVIGAIMHVNEAAPSKSGTRV
jgi:uncharacterized protein